MNPIDLAIVAAIVFGVLIGWRNGLIGPLLGEGTFLIGYWLVSTNPSLAGLVPSGVPRPYALLAIPSIAGVVVGIAGRVIFTTFFKLPLTRHVDRLLGALANGALAFVIVYVVILGLAGAGTVLDPLLRTASIGSPQVAAMRALLAEYPQAAAMVPAGELNQLAGVAAARPVPMAELGQYAQVIDYYEKELRPQLATSQLAPVVLRVGSHLPLIGREVALPKASGAAR